MDPRDLAYCIISSVTSFSVAVVNCPFTFDSAIIKSLRSGIARQAS